MKNILLGIMMLFLIVPFASAVVPDYTVMQGQSYNLIRNCINNGTWCSGSAICNITIQNPDGTILINNGKMTNQGSFHNYTLNASSTSTNGFYFDTVVCSDSGLSGSDTFYHQVTPSGSANILGFFIMMVVISYGITLWGAFARNIPMSIGGGMLMIIVGLYMLVNGFDVYRNLATQGVSLFTIGFGAYWSITAAIEQLND